MNKTMRYWALCIIASILLIIITIFAINNNSRKDHSPSSVQENSAADKDQNIKSMNNTMDQDADQGLEKDNLNRYLNNQDDIQEDMIKAMKKIPKTGNASIDFLQAMIPYNEAVMGLAESYLSYGGDNKILTALANEMLINQNKEMEHYQVLISKYQLEGHINEDKENAFLDDYDTMLDQDHKISKSGTQTLDHAFSEGMISHHRIALEMEKSIIEYTDYDEIRALAENLMTTQKNELEILSGFIH